MVQQNKIHGARAQINTGPLDAGARGYDPQGIQASGWSIAGNGSQYPCTRRHVERRIRRMQSPSPLSA